MWPFSKKRSTDREWQEWAVLREKSAYERGHHDGHGSGWTDGKTKAMQEILNTLDRRHAPDCGCRPCLVIRPCRGEIRVIEATRGIVDLGELPYFPDQVDGILLISCDEAPEDDDCSIDADGYCAHGRLCYRSWVSAANRRPGCRLCDGVRCPNKMHPKFGAVRYPTDLAYIGSGWLKQGTDMQTTLSLMLGCSQSPLIPPSKVVQNRQLRHVRVSSGISDSIPFGLTFLWPR